MKIYKPNEYVLPSERLNPWYQLSVINIWDTKSKVICSDVVDGHYISYCLHLNTKTSYTSYKFEIVEDVNSEINQTLTSMGYKLPNIKNE